jgi:hypothetical protein
MGNRCKNACRHPPNNACRHPPNNACRHLQRLLPLPTPGCGQRLGAVAGPASGGQTRTRVCGEGVGFVRETRRLRAPNVCQRVFYIADRGGPTGGREPTSPGEPGQAPGQDAPGHQKRQGMTRQGMTPPPPPAAGLRVWASSRASLAEPLTAAQAPVRSVRPRSAPRNRSLRFLCDRSPRFLCDRSPRFQGSCSLQKISAR